MNKSPLVSVIVPVYNVEKYVRNCLGSILGQTYKNIELIVVSDASPGGIAGIVSEMQKEYGNIVFVNLKKNLGSHGARIAGMKRAKGEYIVNIDGDDSVCVDYVERLLNRAVETEADIVLGEMIKYGERDKSKVVHNSAKSIDYDEVIKGDGMALSELLRKDNFFWEICGKIYSKSVIDKAISELSAIDRHIVMGEDILFNFHLFYYCDRLARVEFAFYNYLINEGSVTAKSSDVKKKEKSLSDLLFAFDKARDFMGRKGVFNRYRRQYRHIRNMQAAKYFMEIDEDFKGKDRKTLLKMAENIAYDKVGLDYELSIMKSSDFDDINHLIWKLESMNSIKISGLKFLSNIKRKLKSII